MNDSAVNMEFMYESFILMIKFIFLFLRQVLTPCISQGSLE